MYLAYNRAVYNGRPRRLGFLARLLVDWTRMDLFFGAGLISILCSVIIEIRYDAAASALSRDTLGDAVIAGAGGDMIRQIIYFAIFFAVTGTAIFNAKGLPRLPISWPYNLACIWCLTSFVWAIEPGISFRRALGMYIILIAVSLCVQALGAKKTIGVLYMFLAGLVLSSFAAALLSKLSFFSFAVHPDDEIDASLIGAWRGIMPHKNVAGGIMIMSSLFFFHHAINRKKAFDWFLFALCFIFLVMTKSKASIGWFGFVLIAGLVYRFFIMRRSPTAFVFLTLASLATMAVFAFVLEDKLYAFFTNPLSLSGRIEIWQSVFPFIEDHPFLGSGYGSYWAIGYDSPIYATARSVFITQIGHSHSGYVEILLSTGGIGLFLALLALLLLPYLRFVKPLRGDATLNPMLFSIWLFGMLQNMTEAQFFSPDKQSWIIVVIAITISNTRYRASKYREFDWLEKTAWIRRRSAANLGYTARRPENAAAIASNIQVG